LFAGTGLTGLIGATGVLATGFTSGKFCLGEIFGPWTKGGLIGTLVGKLGFESTGPPGVGRLNRGGGG